MVPIIKGLVGALCAVIYRIRWGARVAGTSFIIRKPDLVRVSKGAFMSLGLGVHVETRARIVVRGQLLVGSHVYIGKNSTLSVFDSLMIGDGTLIGENVSIHTENHGPQGKRMEYRSAPIVIGKEVWVGAGVVITGGVTIGDGATVGANAVVTKDIPAGAVALGIPALIAKL